MRKALNENPVAQIAVLGVLAVIVGFLLLTRVAGKSGGDASSATSPTASGAPATSAPADGSSTVPSTTADTTPPATSSDEAPSAPSDGATVPPTGSVSDASVGKFVAGPGLPASVVKAYADDKTVVLLVLKHRGIDDDQLRRNVERLHGRSDLALFVTNAGRIARYSRITQGVSVDRVPALIVLRPRHLTHGTPTASVSYGVRGPESVDQAIRNALYKGPSNLPYYPK
ncbi:MAG: hypothetical protein AABM42_11415 [Actinomycetota bacterium]